MTAISPATAPIPPTSARTPAASATTRSLRTVAPTRSRSTGLTGINPSRCASDKIPENNAMIEDTVEGANRSASPRAHART